MSDYSALDVVAVALEPTCAEISSSTAVRDAKGLAQEVLTALADNGYQLIRKWDNAKDGDMSVVMLNEWGEG